MDEHTLICPGGYFAMLDCTCDTPCKGAHPYDQSAEVSLGSADIPGSPAPGDASTPLVRPHQRKTLRLRPRAEDGWEFVWE